MSEWKVEIVEIGKVGRHPNADSLAITSLYGGYPVIFRSTEEEPGFALGDKAVYVPVDSLVPRTPEFEFLFPADKPERDRERVRAKRLRGIFSMGLLIPVPQKLSDLPVGTLVHDYFEISKYEPPEALDMNGIVERDPGILSVYDIEGLRRWPDILQVGEEVVLTEKIHGANGRFVFWEDTLYIGGRTQYHKAEHSTIWWSVARKYGLDEMLPRFPGIAIFGEVYGKVQKLKYGLKDSVDLLVFDIFNANSRVWFDYDIMLPMAAAWGLPVVPELYRGPWKTDLSELAEGNSTLADHVREGFVVRPVKERWDDRIQRVILKQHGEGYLTHKNA